MKIHALYLFTACQIIFTSKKYLISFVLFNLAFIWLLLYIPVRNIPGNDFAFQLSILTPKDIVLLITLSSLTALSIMMNLYVLRRRFSPKASIALVGQGGFGGVTGIIGSIFGTTSCAACVTSLFGFLGIGGIFFLLQYKQIITFAAIILILIPLYFTSKNVLGVDDACRVNYKQKKL